MWLIASRTSALSSTSRIGRAGGGSAVMACISPSTLLPLCQARNHGDELFGLERLLEVALESGLERVQAILLTCVSGYRHGGDMPPEPRLEATHLSNQSIAVLAAHRDIAHQ